MFSTWFGHGQHHLEHSLQHFQLHQQRGPAEGRPPSVDIIENATNVGNILHCKNILSLNVLHTVDINLYIYNLIQIIYSAILYYSYALKAFKEFFPIT